MLFKHNSRSSYNKTITSTSFCNQRLHPALEMPISKGEDLGFYKGLKLKTPSIAPTIVHPSFSYPEIKGVIQSRTIKPTTPFHTTYLKSRIF